MPDWKMGPELLCRGDDWSGSWIFLVTSSTSFHFRSLTYMEAIYVATIDSKKAVNPKKKVFMCTSLISPDQGFTAYMSFCIIVA